MATAKEGGDTANGASSSSYGGGGAGGKFRKKPFRRQGTPYDRPPTAHRVENDKNSSWLRKLVVEPASKFISYGAGRFFAPLLRKRLPPPPPPEAEADVSDEDHEAVRDSQDGVQESPGGNCSQPINNSSSNGISELEQLFKQRTFTRSEIVHLRELLQSRSVEVSMEDVAQKNEVTATDYATHQQFASELLEENINGGNRSALISTPVVNRKVIEDDNASPAELAKAYMGSRPSKVSPSVLGMRSRIGREDTRLLSSLPSASSSPIMALTKKAPNTIAAPDNGFITPRSRGRSAIYSMARTPYSKVHLISNPKGTGINNNGYAGPSMSSPYLSPMESDEKFESRPTSLKRRSSVFDDEVGSIGPIRRIRQKPSLLASRIHHTAHGFGIGSHAKQKLPLNGESSHRVSKDVGEDENESVPTSSYSRVPSKSSEVASKILQHLEKMTPKEKSSESKLVSRREKSPLTLTQNMLSGRALRSMEDANSSKLMLDVHDDHKFGDRSNATLVDACDLSTQKHEKENDPNTYVASFHVAKNDYVVSLKASTSSAGATDYIGKTGAFQPTQNKRAFRMSAQEDYFEQDDDANELAPRPFSEKKGTMETSLKDSKVAPSAEPKLVKPSVRPADKSPLSPFSKTSEANSSAVTLREVGNDVSSPASERTKAASHSAVFPLSVSAFDKPKEATNPPLFSFSSVAVEKVDSLPSESIKDAELKIESSSSVLNVSASSGSQVKIPESDKSSHLNNLFKAGDVNGNGPPTISSSPPPSFSAASNDADQVPKGSASQFPSLISGGNSVPFSTSTASNGSIFGLKPNPSIPAAPVFKFSSPVDPSTTNILADKKSEMDPSSGGSSSSLSNAAPLSAVNSGSSTFGFGSSVSFSATNSNHQGSSLFANASKPLVSDAGIGLHGTTSQSVVSSSASSLPALNVNSSTSLGSTSSSQGFNTSSGFGFTLPASASASTSTSTSTISAPIAGGGPTISAVKFGASSTEGTAVSSASGASSATFSFGFGSNSSSTNAVGSSTASLFGFPANSSSSALVTNTSSSLSSGTSAIFAFGGSSPAPSSSAPNSSSVFGSSWQSTKSSTPVFGSSAFTSPSPSTGFAFGAAAVSAPSLSAPSVFNNPSSSGSAFSFTAASPAILSSPSVSQPVFGNSPRGFGAAASPDQMNAEDSMAEDNVVQTSAAAAAAAAGPPGFPTFGQQPASSTPSAFGQPASTPPAFGQPASSTPPAFGFGSSSVASQPNPFLFGGQQQNQAVAPQQNPSPFQASGSLDQFNAGGSFSLGSGGGDKSGRKIVRINRNKNRKK